MAVTFGRLFFLGVRVDFLLVDRIFLKRKMLFLSYGNFHLGMGVCPYFEWDVVCQDTTGCRVSLIEVCYIKFVLSTAFD